MTTFAITVLNPKGKDPEQVFPDYAGIPNPKIHAPVNFHAYAACTGGSFHSNVKKVIELNKPVLMLVRNNFKLCLKTLRTLKNVGITVAVSLKETGSHQVANQLKDGSKLSLLKEIVNESDGVISPTQAMVPIYQSLKTDNPQTVRFIPTPYPVESNAWDFSVPIDERNGIFLGTRELKTYSRNHLASLILVSSLVKKTGCRLTLINKDGRLTSQFIAALGIPSELVNVISPMPYPDYLRMLANHRIVFQLDQSMVPGQVAGDCCLCRVVCVGGNGSVESLVYPDFSNFSQNREELLVIAEKLLTNDSFYSDVTTQSEERAGEFVSFSEGAKNLKYFFDELGK